MTHRLSAEYWCRKCEQISEDLQFIVSSISQVVRQNRERPWIIPGGDQRLRIDN